MFEDKASKYIEDILLLTVRLFILAGVPINTVFPEDDIDIFFVFKTI
jgi:hypothetical protein